MGEEDVEYIFTFRVKRRKRVNPSYEGVLRYYRYYIDYLSLLRGQDPVKAGLGGSEPLISFPIRFNEVLLDFAGELGGSIVDVRRIGLRRGELFYEKPFVSLPNEIAFRRHLLFSLTASTYRVPSRLNTLKKFVLGMNANFLNVLTTIALDRFKEVRGTSSPAWHWYMFRVGRAVKVLYNLD